MKTQKHLTPLKAIRRYCLWCCNGQSKEIELCPATDCRLHSLRFGRKPKKEPILKISTLKTIKAKCLDCGEGTAQAVRKCEFETCLLFPFRNGKNPARKGLGGNIHNILSFAKKRP